MAKKTPELSVTAKAILDLISKSRNPLSLDEIKKAIPDANSSHLTALRNRGLVSAEKVEKEVTVTATREVNVYSKN
jgi:DNA-binding transcriptional ArsR family regulator